MKIVVSLGGNSLIRKGQKGTYEEQLENIEVTCKELAKIVKEGHKIIINHGNGPQVGNLLIQQEKVKEIPSMPLDVLVAMTEGQIGYLIQNCLKNKLKKLNIVTLITQVIVDENDKSFKNPTKPIGPYYKEKIYENMVYIEGFGYRRVVASPKPIDIVEKEVIRKLFNKGYIVIAGGGGGVPVIKKGSELIGVEAVIDKDYVAAKIAEIVKADALLILTDVDGVIINFGRENETKIDKLTIKEAEKYLKEGQFYEGRMKPKIEACIEFLRKGGKFCFIGLPEKASEVIKGKSGSTIIP